MKIKLEKYWRKDKKKEKANIQFSFFTHASYCGSETTTITTECNGSGEFDDDVDVVQTSDTGIQMLFLMD